MVEPEKKRENRERAKGKKARTTENDLVNVGNDGIHDGKVKTL